MADGDKKKTAQPAKSTHGAQNGAQNGTAKSAKTVKKKKKTPLWLKIARFLYAFFTALGEWIAEKAKALWAFLKDFFSGLPDGIRYLIKKNKKKRAERKKEKATAKAQKEQSVRNAPPKAQRDAEIKEKKQAEKRQRIEQKAEKRKKEERERALKARGQAAAALEKPRKAAEKKLGRWGLRFLPYVILGVLIFYLSALLLTFGILYVKDGVSLPKGQVLMSTTVDGVEYKNNISAANAYPDGGQTLYFSMNVFAEHFDISTVCDGETAVFTLKNGESAKMRKNSRTVELNGSTIDLPAPVHIRENKVYVPLELLIRYTRGLNVSVGKDKITLLQEQDEERSKPKAPVYEELRFTVCGIRPAEKPGFER